MWAIAIGFLKNRLGKWLPLVALVAGLGMGWFATAEYYTGKIAKDERDRLLSVVEAQNEVASTVSKQQLITEEVSNEHEKNRAAMRAGYDAEFERLRDKAAADAYLSTLPHPTGQHHAAACPERFSARTQERITRLIKQADEQTKDLVACQAWIAKQRAQ